MHGVDAPANYMTVYIYPLFLPRGPEIVRQKIITQSNHFYTHEREWPLKGIDIPCVHEVYVTTTHRWTTGIPVDTPGY